ncbi:MAG TPA: type II toxin-antitoxin system PemK/MazF family toxin [Thermoanaerobaculia bacterium]|jgi:mRNA interferase MazF|nr:type II toxin-antitoxin system PemK/MazF family toxin [Thermoanaerobaculia bacterium]
MKRGDIFWAELSPRSGSEQQGRRPVLIISHNAFNEIPAWQSVIVIPCSTSSAQRRRGPTAVFLPAGTGGLPEDCFAICHQITTLDRSKLTRRIGVLPESALRSVEGGLRAAVDLVS